jgi:hypothetical protein
LKKIKEEEEKEEKKEEKKEEAPADNENEDEDDGEGGMFGGLMMDEEQESVATPTPTSQAATVQRNIVDLAVPKSWMGKYPKDLLLEYCNKHKLGKQSFSSDNVGSGIWRASLKIVKDGYSSIPLKFELPEELGASNRHDAEQLIALFTLFDLDSNSAVYKVLSTSYKDVWTAWFEEKVEKYMM